MKLKTYVKLRNTVAVFLAIFVFLFFAVLFLLIASLTADYDARTLPTYAQEDLGEILAKPKEARTDEDYEILSMQTGVLLRSAVEQLSDEEILQFQRAFFFEGEVRHEQVAITTVRDMLFNPETGQPFYAPIVALEPGDILVTSTAHTFGWRNGHAALALERGRLLQSFSLGYPSEIVGLDTYAGLPLFCSGTNFMVLRLKNATLEERLAIARDAEEQLKGIPYTLIVGIFMAKDQGTMPEGTHCSHLVWQAYKNAGYDIDPDGGPVVTCRDIANSPYFEIVQTYGFDPLSGW